jgi:hypothetical protein
MIVKARTCPLAAIRERYTATDGPPPTSRYRRVKTPIASRNKLFCAAGIRIPPG